MSGRSFDQVEAATAPILNAETRALLQSLLAAIRPLTKRFWTEDERALRDAAPYEVWTTAGAIRKATLLQARVAAVLDRAPTSPADIISD